VLLAAYAVAKEALPTYAHRFSPKKFTQPQLLACLILKEFFKTDYRGIEAILADSPTLLEAIGLRAAPHFTTLQKAATRLAQGQCRAVAGFDHSLGYSHKNDEATRETGCDGWHRTGVASRQPVFH